MIQELVQGGELHWIHLLGEFRADAEVVFDDLRCHRRRDGRTGVHDKIAHPESLSYNQGSSGDNVILDNEVSYQALSGRHSGTLNESTNVGVKTGGSRVWGPELCV